MVDMIYIIKNLQHKYFTTIVSMYNDKIEVEYNIFGVYTIKETLSKEL